LNHSVSPLYIGGLKGTPLGDFLLATTDDGLVLVEWTQDRAHFENYLERMHRPIIENQAHIAVITNELDEYLSGGCRRFTFPIDWSNFRPFQRLVLQATLAIPYGETRTYHQLAIQIGRPRSARAVGRAEATNPMPLVIPCHRVIGSDGRLHGYGGGQGLMTKEWLLKLEGTHLS